MKNISRYFFMAGGVILPRLSLVTLDWIEKKNSNPASNKQRQSIFQAEKDLLTGKLSPESYLSLAAACGSGATAQDVLKGLFSEIKVDQGALSTACDLKKNGRVYLVSDYPRPWLEEAACKTPIFECFSPDDVLYTAELGLGNDVSSLFDVLSSKSYLHPDANMWVDAYPLRTSEAVRRGIDAIIYVEERRLRRELKLRNLLEN